MGEQDQAGFKKQEGEGDEIPIVEENEISSTDSDDIAVSSSEVDDDGQYKRIEGLPGVGEDEPQTRGASNE